MNDLDSQSDEVRGGKGRRSGGASLTMRDGRVSAFIGWFYGAIGLGIITLLGVASRNLYDLNVTVARGIDSDAARDIEIHDHEQRLREVERDVSIINGKIFRGEVDEFGLKPDPPPKEVRRGH